MRGLLITLCLFVATAAFEAKAECGLHSCESVSFGFSSGFNPGLQQEPGPFVFNTFGSRSFFFGPGGGAFRRSFRLQRQAFRAASRGNFLRAERLEARADRTFARGVRRGGGFVIMPFWF